MPRLPDSIFQTAEKAIEERRDMRWRQVFSIPMRTKGGGAVMLHFDITEYKKGKLRHKLDDINYAVNVREWARSPSAKKVDRDYAKGICIKKNRKPVLVARIENHDGTVHDLVIDGNHRLYRANMVNLKTYPAHRLTVDETKAITVTDEEMRLKYQKPKGSK